MNFFRTIIAGASQAEAKISISLGHIPCDLGEEYYFTNIQLASKMHTPLNSNHLYIFYLIKLFNLSFFIYKKNDGFIYIIL